MNTKFWTITIISGIITGGGLIGYRYLTNNVLSAFIVISGLVVLISLQQFITLYITRKMNVPLSYSYSFLMLVVSAFISNCIFFIDFLYGEEFHPYMIIGYLAFFLPSILIGAIISFFFRNKRKEVITHTGQLDDPNF